MFKKICRSCVYFPCLRKECDIKNENVCSIYMSTVEAAIKQIDIKAQEEMENAAKEML